MSLRERDEDADGVRDIEMDTPLEPRPPRVVDQAVVEAVEGQSRECCCSCEYTLGGQGDLQGRFQLMERYVPEMSVPSISLIC
jgi:hypothetical protein